MARNQSFQLEREPLQHINNLQLNSRKTKGPFSFLNPTQAHFDHVNSPISAESSTVDQSNAPSEKQQTSAGDSTTNSNVAYKWTSRNNRKGRHAIVVKPSSTSATAYTTPPPTNNSHAILSGIWRMLTYYPVWDVSFLVAYVFTWGSVIWVINAFFAFLPFLRPPTEFKGEVYYGGGITAFIGATVFEVGSILLMMEAVNENRTGCFGWAVEQVYVEHFSHETGESKRLVPQKNGCSHHHGNTKNLVGKPPARKASMESSETSSSSSTTQSSPNTKKSWVWFPSTQELRTHYLHDLGFLACCSQMFGATVFWISGITALPGIYNVLDTPAKLNGAYWAPQIIGGCGFVISGTLFMIETQEHWWKPAPRVLGWHIGMWNLIGGVGFTVCPIFGLYTQHWAEYQASCSTFWGSWAFLIGSVIQWYESLEKYPVEVENEE